MREMSMVATEEECDDCVCGGGFRHVKLVLRERARRLRAVVRVSVQWRYRYLRFVLETRILVSFLVSDLATIE